MGTMVPKESRARNGKQISLAVSRSQRTSNTIIDIGMVLSHARPYLAIQVVMMPRDTNPLGSIFGA